jgi:Papain family cysteine protease
MTRSIRFAALFLWLSLGLLPGRAPAEEPAPGPGSRIDSLTVGPITYRQVQVRSVNARTLMITHAGGMASIHLHDLSPEWQERFHFDPVADAAAEEAAKTAPHPASVVQRAKPALKKGVSKFDALLLKFGQPAAVQTEVDLRPKFFQLELGVKNQGFRPSCAVFAIVSALEFQNAELTGKVEKFSEEYLIWAVRKSVRRLPAVTKSTHDPNGEEYQDEGFALSEVVAALRAYGIPLQASMPNTFGSRIEAIEDPPAAIVQEARNHQRVFVHQLPGRDGVTRLNNIVQTLNAGLPVAVGMSWPGIRVINGYLSTQKGAPDRGHAVTLVGYKSPSGRLDDTYFIFKNSWGPRWGQGGYGTVTYGYLSNYLSDAVLLEVQTGGG